MAFKSFTRLHRKVNFVGSRTRRLLLVLSVIVGVIFAIKTTIDFKYYAIVTVEVPPGLVITFLRKTSRDKNACESAGETVISAATAKCANCKITRNECLSSLPAELSSLLDEKALPTPSARTSNGIITYAHPDPNVAIAVCLESEKLVASMSTTPITCDLPNKPRPIPAAFVTKTDVSQLVWDYFGPAIALLLASIAVLLAVQFATARHPNDLTEPVGFERSNIKASKVFKRLFDVSVAVILLLLLLPIFAIIATLIFVLEGLPIFYISRRFISTDQNVSILKFRTMVKDATSPKYRLRERYMRDGYLDIPLSCEVYTPIGRLLERTQLVESLQLLNIIIHGMSFVGNRPLPKDNVELLSRMQGWEQRFNSPAGITGLSQVAGKLNLSPKDRIELEGLYSKAFHNPTVNILWVDFMILFYTARLLFLNKHLAIEHARQLCGANPTIESK